MTPDPTEQTAEAQQQAMAMAQAAAMRMVALSQPAQWNASAVRTPNGPMVHLNIVRNADSTQLLMDPKFLIDLGRYLIKTAREAISGLTIVERPKPRSGPGGAVDLSYAQHDGDVLDEEEFDASISGDVASDRMVAPDEDDAPATDGKADADGE